MTERAELFRYENKKYTILYSLIILRSGPINLVTYYSNKLAVDSKMTLWLGVVQGLNPG